MNNFFKNKTMLTYPLYFIMVFSLLYVMGQVMNLDLALSRQLVTVFIITLASKIIFKNKVLFYASLVVLLVGGLLGYYYGIQDTIAFENISIFSTHVYDHIFNGATLASEYIYPFWIVLAVFYAIFSALIIFRIKRMQGLLIVLYLPIFLYYWYYLGVNESYYALAIFLFAYFGLYGQTMFGKEKQKADLQKPIWLRTAFLYSLFAIGIAFILPKTDNRIEWPWLDNQMSAITSELDADWFNNRSTANTNQAAPQANQFDFTTTGFQTDPSRLGGPISPRQEIIMSVQADRPTYLRGAVKHHYNGNSWVEIETESAAYEMGDYFSRPDEYGVYYENRNVTVEFEDYSSTTLFAPFHTIDIQAEGQEQFTVTRDDIINFSKKIGENESYQITSLEAPSYALGLELELNNHYEDLDYIEEYLQVPLDRITQRTIALKDEIINRVEGDYQKAIAFESFLSNNYSYTLDTAHIPEDHEFIDYFLFEEQAGYCTYFATALTIFLRLEGIPSRYVEGYIARETTDDENYVVRGSHAHAWVEAYIEPVGWVTLEPTASFTDANGEIQTIVEEDTEDLLTEEPDTDIAEPEIEEMMPEEEESPEDLEEDILSEDGMNLTENNTEEMAAGQDTPTPRYLFTLVLGVLFLIVMLFIFFFIKQRKKRETQAYFQKQENNKKLILLYQDILEQLKYLGYAKKSSETYSEFSKRFNQDFDQLEEITAIFIRSEYGNIAPTNFEIQKLLAYRSELADRVRSSLNRFEYFIYKCKTELKVF